jgi:rhombotail lipoprotein
MMRTLIAVLLAGLATGCSAGFDRVAMQQSLAEERRIFTDDEDVLKIESLRPQVQFPIRLAVVPPSAFCTRAGKESRLTPEDEREELTALGEQLKKDGIVSDFILVPEMLLKTGLEPWQAGYLKSVRIAAARLQADAVLILRSVTDVDSYINPLGILDLSVAGMFLVPGHHKDALTLVEGLVIDNRNQFLYFAASAEGKGSTLGPLAVIDEKDAVQESRKNALHAFGGSLAQEARRARLFLKGSRYETPDPK